MERTELSKNFGIGSRMPLFSLLSTTEDTVSSNQLSGKPCVVFFTCNHCPYVKGSEDALATVVNKFSETVNFVGINSNNAEQYPEDSFEKMIQKADAMKIGYQYLYDETQEVARLFDAACTPEFYLFNSESALVYHGTINNSPRDPNAVTESYLNNAIEQVLSGEKCSPEFVHPLGCSIKWK